MDLGEISSARAQLMTVWVVAGVLLVIFVPGFLAARGLGCLLLLGAAVILDAAFLVTTPWRFVMTILAYYWVIGGWCSFTVPISGAMRSTTRPRRRNVCGGYPGREPFSESC